MTNINSYRRDSGPVDSHRRASNAWAKTRDKDSPYFEVEANGWTWRILKAYQSAHRARENHYARYLCAVQSPFTHGSWDIGDTYIRDIPHCQRILDTQAEAERA